MTTLTETLESLLEQLKKIENKMDIIKPRDCKLAITSKPDEEDRIEISGKGSDLLFSFYVLYEQLKTKLEMTDEEFKDYYDVYKVCKEEK